MTTWALAILGVAVLISIGEQLSVRAVSSGDVTILPADTRRRVLWMQGQARHVHLMCLLAGAVALGLWLVAP